MIFNFFVFDKGLCIYSYNYREEVSIPEDFFSGFLTALGTFAQEVFKDEIHEIRIKNNQILVLYAEKKYNLTFCTISDDRDNKHLLQKHLRQIADTFIEKMEQFLRAGATSDTKAFTSFDSILKDYFVGKVTPRYQYLTLLGMIIGYGVFFGFALFLELFRAPLFYLQETAIQSLVWYLFYYFLQGIVFGGLILTCFITGYITKNAKLGGICGLLITSYTVFLWWHSNISWYLLFFTIYAWGAMNFPITIFMGAVMGYIGGEMSDRKNLYPLGVQDEKKFLNLSSIIALSVIVSLFLLFVINYVDLIVIISQLVVIRVILLYFDKLEGKAIYNILLVNLPAILFVVLSSIFGSVL